MAATTHHPTEQQQEIPPGTHCELCGMVAEVKHKDQHGVTHYYCGHHAPPQSEAHGDHGAAGHDGPDQHGTPQAHGGHDSGSASPRRSSPAATISRSSSDR